jgi:hypothetical protein
LVFVGVWVVVDSSFVFCTTIVTTAIAIETSSTAKIGCSIETVLLLPIVLRGPKSEAQLHNHRGLKETKEDRALKVLE